MDIRYLKKIQTKIKLVQVYFEMKQVLRQEALLENRRMFHDDKGSIYQENTTVLNWHAPNYTALKQTKKSSPQLQWKNLKNQSQ